MYNKCWKLVFHSYTTWILAEQLDTDDIPLLQVKIQQV